MEKEVNINILVGETIIAINQKENKYLEFITGV